MATPWLRLWVDMPNDPKWRTIARSSKQTISSVLAVYLHILVIGSNANERGRTQGLCSEDIGSALDLETDQVDSILCAMQGKVLDGDYITGWEKRQPIREDGSSERGKAHREAKKLASNATERTANALRTQANATERKQTLEVEVDIEVENTSLVDFADEQDNFDCLEEILLPTNDAERAMQQHAVLVHPAKPVAKGIPCPQIAVLDLYQSKLPDLAQPRKSLWLDGKNAPTLKARWDWVMTARHESGSRTGERMATTEQEGLDWFDRFFSYVSRSDHLMGRRGDWSCDLIWLVTKANFEKVISGVYVNKEKAA